MRIADLGLRIGGVLLVGVLAWPGSVGSEQIPQVTGQAQGSEAGEPIRRGAALGDSPFVPLAELLGDPAKFVGSSVTTEGLVARVCTHQGCWMELTPPEADAAGLRVVFKDYGFFVPTDAKAMRAKAEGVLTMRALSQEEADHLVEEGAKLARTPEGTATEVCFVATGVQLSGAPAGVPGP